MATEADGVAPLASFPLFSETSSNNCKAVDFRLVRVTSAGVVGAGDVAIAGEAIGGVCTAGEAIAGEVRTLRALLGSFFTGLTCFRDGFTAFVTPDTKGDVVLQCMTDAEPSLPRMSAGDILGKPQESSSGIVVTDLSISGLVRT